MLKRYFVILILLFAIPTVSIGAYAQSAAEPSFEPHTRSPVKDAEKQQKIEERRARRQLELEGGDTGADAEPLDSGPSGADKEIRRAEEGAREKMECEEGDRECLVNQRVQDIEDLVQQTREKQKSESIWALPDVEKDENGKAKTGQYIIAAPTTYVARFLTWPIAVLADFLIKKGVVSDVINVVSNKERTFWVYPQLEMGFGNGFGGGIGIRDYDLFDKNYDFNANYIVYVNLDQKGGFGLSKPDLVRVAGMPIGFRFETKLLHDKDSSYYGLGIGSQQSNDSKYLIDAIYSGVAGTFEPYENVVFDLGFFFLSDHTAPGESPSVDTVFPLSELPGFGRDLSYFVPGISLTRDTRDAVGRPSKGGLQRGAFGRFQGLGVNGMDFNLYMLEVQQYIKLRWPRHILVLRTAWQYRQPTSGGEVPFFHLSRLDVYSPMRGFGWGRFRDRGSMVFNIEYRFPVWEYMDGEFFFDTGRVFHDMSDISFKHMKFDGGGGIRLTTKNYFLLRFDVAYGGEGAKVLFKTSQAF